MTVVVSFISDIIFIGIGAEPVKCGAELRSGTAELGGSVELVKCLSVFC